MNAGELFDKLKHEAKALMGEESKDKYYPVEQEFPDEAAAKKEFLNAKKRLFNIAKWSEESGIKSTFELYDNQVQKTNQDPKVGFFMKIILPGLPMDNWVEITDVINQENLVSFTVHPCPDPQTSDESENIAALLKIATDQDLVSLVYQPIKNVVSGRIRAR